LQKQPSHGVRPTRSRHRISSRRGVDLLRALLDVDSNRRRIEVRW
jgi:hypothetical protein